MSKTATVEVTSSRKSYWVLYALFAFAVLTVLLLNQITAVRSIITAVTLAVVFILKKPIACQKRRYLLLYWLAAVMVFSAAFLLSRPAAHNIYLNNSGKEILTNTIKTEYGSIYGIYNSDKTVKEFAGIPYAKPPVGSLRWRAPQPPVSWRGIRLCDHFSDCEVQSGLPTPVSKLMYLSMGTDALSHSNIKDDEKTSEDCLYLNIWSGAKSPSERRPVIVYIHGGSFTSGSGSIDLYNGESMAKKGAVFVTINYRVGIFGFYANPELTKESGYNASGNYGILDQIAALKWVKENIAAFGGNSDNITVAGESAGSMSVSILQASPLAKGLFQRVIAESGGYFGSQGYKHAPMETLAFAEKDGVKLERSLHIKSVSALRKLSASALVSASKTVSTRPVLDDYILHDTVYNTFAKGKENDVPALIGSNANESTLWMSLPWPVSMSPDYSPMNNAEFHKIINKTYGSYANQFFSRYPTVNTAKTIKSELKSATTQWFLWHMHSWARLQSSKAKSKVFYYYFNKTQPGPSALQALGAYHSSEIAYAYGNLHEVDLPYTSSDYRLSNIMSSYWLNFAKAGNPNGSGLPHWKPYCVNTDQVMQFGNSVKMIAEPDRSDLSFFDKYEAALRNSQS